MVDIMGAGPLQPAATEAPPGVEVEVVGVLTGCTNPESAELLGDGETIVFGNCAMTVGLDAYRAGKGLVYLIGEAFVSTARIDRAGNVEMVEPRLVEGLTGTLGCDVVRTDGGPFPVGTYLIAEGGAPRTRDRVQLEHGSSAAVVAIDPRTGAIRGRIPLGDGSAVAARYNALDQPNGLALAPDGTLYVGDIPNSNPDPDPAAPPPVPPAVYRIPPAALGALAAGEGGADDVDRIEMPGYVNGLTVSPVDGAVWAVSCSSVDPVGGGVYRLGAGDFEAGRQPDPVWRGLGVLDGVTVTERGTVIVSNPRTSVLTAFTADGGVVTIEPAGEVATMPADINVCYPACLGGRPALLVPEISVGKPPGSGRILVLDLGDL
jgi:hypothetical protein